ncbi:MAG: RNase P modulator RnpM [Acutalibacteraceae bacterium]
MAEGKKRKIPMRMCVACGEMKPKKELIRVVKPKEGEIALDFTGKAAGRGAYVCKSADCFDKLRRGKRLNRTFSCEVPQEVYDRLMREIGE